jgi:DNA replication protein DnaC
MPGSTTTSSERFYAERERRAREAAMLRREMRGAAIQAKLERTIPEAYRDARVSDPGCAAWLAGYRAGKRVNLVLVGGTGTTKTTQAYALCAELMRSGVNCTFGTSGGLLRHIRRAYDGDFTEEEAVEQLSGVPVLFIDDLGKESPTQWAVERLFDIIDARAAGMKPVVVTTNLGSRALRQRYGEPGGPMISRLCGNGAVAVRFDGPDRRLHG